MWNMAAVHDTGFAHVHSLEVVCQAHFRVFYRLWKRSIR